MGRSCLQTPGYQTWEGLLTLNGYPSGFQWRWECKPSRVTPTLFTVQSGYEQERWYSNWTWPDEMVYSLDLCRGGGLLTWHCQERWCTTDCAWAEEIVNWLDMGSRDCVLAGHEFKRWYSDWPWREELVNGVDIGRRDSDLTQLGY